MGLEDIINGVPVFGHAKAGFHLLTGDARSAGKAFKAATRTTAVMAGGAAGALVGGPAGMVGGAMAAGTACDAVTSVANREAEGVFDGLKDVVKDIGNGEVPVKSLIKTGLYVGADAISGATGGSIAGNIPKEIGKSLVKDAAVVVAKSTTQAMVATAATGNASREIAKTITCEQSYKSSGGYLSGGGGGTSSGSSNQAGGSQSSGSSTTSKGSGPSAGTGSSGGGKPPQNNKNDTPTEHQIDLTQLSHFDLLCALFGASSLSEIVIAGVKIFQEITGGKSTDRARKNSLKKLIQALREDGIIERVLQSVKNIMTQLDRSEVTFQNFLYVTEMVAAHVTDRLARRHEMQASRDPRPRIPFHQRRAENLRTVLAEIMDPGNANNILDIFKALRSCISGIWTTISPTFTNIITAVTHYFKHKFVPASFRTLSAAEYFALVQTMLSYVTSSTQYAELRNSTRRRLVYDRYFPEYGRRVRIVIQLQNGVIVVSSCHILDIIVIFDDKEGNEEFDPPY